MSQPTPIKVAVYLYPKADVLDFTGPAEAFSAPSPSFGPPPFTVTTFAHHTPIHTACAALTYVPNATFSSVASTIEDYDVLVIPGSSEQILADLIASNKGKQVIAMLQRFAAAPPRKEIGKRVLQSVCTGAILVAAAGVLTGRKVTTHHLSFAMLKRVADEAAGGDSQIQIMKELRWVDGGLNEQGVRIVHAAGVSSGIDVSVWTVGHFAGEAQKKWVAEFVEFEPRDAAWGFGVQQA
ncbi:ThiJ/PfpI family protein-like protein [Plenodomus tracheiphilus IPT5]|uniref:ThiJ/PfpI family protein-like protein n=1 Tax=Plenodomus tracheiphilus IPT5 TaxID=1408161 RepID=A0A6A7B4E9_9PLEO|nr:ThiJ/PfpI family protein-like protein [Plenodomus tracheiphilus IPT5]